MSEAQRVAIVEDDEDIREFTRLTLEALGGFEVTAYPTAEGMLEAVVDAQPDVVLLDVQLPGISGYEALRRLRDDPRTAALPVVLFTARVEAAQRERGEQLAATDIIPKTCDPKELCARLRQAARQRG